MCFRAMNDWSVWKVMYPEPAHLQIRLSFSWVTIFVEKDIFYQHFVSLMERYAREK